MTVAPSIISLIQHGLHLKLNWGFGHFISFYRSLLAPVIELVHLPVRWLLSLAHIRWTVPAWLKDVQILSFILSGMYLRAADTLSHAGTRWVDSRVPAKRYLGAASRALRYFLLGFFALGYIAWTAVLAQAAWAVGSTPLTGTAYDNRLRAIALLFALGRVAVATTIAVLLFYVGNGVVPQIQAQPQ